jgi:hypothetical protein
MRHQKLLQSTETHSAEASSHVFAAKTVYLNETYTRVQEGRHLSDWFPIKNGLKKGHTLLPLL